MANYVQIDKFESGDIDDFIDHFEICSLANEWPDEKKALMIATCLKGESLDVYKSLHPDDRKVYDTVHLIKFTSLSEFHQRTMHPDETPQKDLYELKRLLQKAFPEMFEGARKQLLFEQYIRGLPRYVYENIRVSPDVKTTEDALKRAQVVIRMHSENSNQDLDGVATVSIGKESKQEEEKIKCEKAFAQEAIAAAVKAITEKMTLTNTDRSDYACTIQRGMVGSFQKAGSQEN